MSFKPWGDINIILPKFTPLIWNFIGCASTEDRCTTGLTNFLNLSNIKDALFYNIIDPNTTSTHNLLTQTNIDILKSKGIDIIFEEYKLYESLRSIENSINNYLKFDNHNIVLDISSFPKRFFFPLLKFLIKRYNHRISNLLVIYTSPLKYAESDLSSDPNPWSPLPMFGYLEEDTETDVAIIGLGFMPFNLPDLLKDEFTTVDRRFLFPFPPGPPFYQRTWSFLENVNNARAVRNQDIKYVDPANVFDIFDLISNICNNGSRNALLAPYGPKTVSLAMCLYACNHSSAVYYTQPTTYNPHYSTGSKETTVYPLIINKQPIF